MLEKYSTGASFNLSVVAIWTRLEKQYSDSQRQRFFFRARRVSAIGQSQGMLLRQAVESCSLSPFWAVILSLILLVGGCLLAFLGFIAMFVGPRRIWIRLESRFTQIVLEAPTPLVARCYILTIILCLCLALLLSNVFTSNTLANFFTEFGTLIAIVSFFYIIQELYKAKRKADEIEKATNEAIEKERTDRYRYHLSEADGLLGQVVVLLNAKAWPYASFRLGDLQRGLIIIDSQNRTVGPRWIELRNMISPWLILFRGGQNGEPLDYDGEEWSHVHDHILMALWDQLSQGSLGNGGNDGD